MITPRSALVLLCLATSSLLPSALAQSNSSPMKAIVAHEYGPPTIVKYEDAPRPEPKENEALVRVIASGVNPADPLIVSGKYAQEFGTQVPLIPGYDIAGIVEKTGSAVTKMKVGDAVYGYPLMGGGWAQYCVVTETEAAPKPPSLSFVEAGAVPLAALTAWQALIKTAGLTSGQKVLIHGGSGGVGSFAVQIAKARGARVIATASTRNQDLLKQLGVDVPIDYTKQKFEEIAKDVDVALDTVGHDIPARTYPVVKKGGIICEIAGSLSRSELEKYGIRGAGIAVTPNADDLVEITNLIEAKKIKPIVTQVLPLSEGVKALEQAETHHTRGKVVLKIADEPKN
ncbi:MAG: NADP-dependent oxidoreductase [Chthoniobacterales bacterium]